MRTRVALVTMAALGTGLVGGCPITETRTNNQGGGSLLTAGVKLLNAQLANLTPDEVQILVDRVDERKASLEIDLSDEQAQAIVDFLRANNLSSIEAVAAVINNPGALVIPESLEALVEAGDLPDIRRVRP